MAYSDIQNKVSQIRMANRILLAQEMDPNKTPETDLSGFQEQGGYAPEEGDTPLLDVEEETPVEGTLTERKKLFPDYKGNRKFPKVKRKKKSDADIQTEGNMKGQLKPEDIFGPDYEGGPTYLNIGNNLNRLLQIGGGIGGVVGGGVLPLLYQLLIGNPNAMAKGKSPFTTPFYEDQDDLKKFRENADKILRGKKKKNLLAINQGPSTPVGIYDFGDGKRVFPKIQPFKIRKIKKGVKGKL